MNGYELVQVWKNPDHRRDGSDVDHPAGEIALDYVGGNADLVSSEYLYTIGCCGGLTRSPTCESSCGGGCIPTAWTYGLCCG
jgi:hypothetical protein